MSAKKVKVVALRLPADTQQLIKDGAQRSETTQPDFVQAALELAQEDRDTLERVYKKAKEIRRARTVATALAAVDTKTGAFANYAEEWPIRPVEGGGDFDSKWIRWTHNQLDAIASQFATTDYWHDRFHHWKHASEEDQAILVHEWRMTMAALPVPVRYLCWCVLTGISTGSFSHSAYMNEMGTQWDDTHMVKKALTSSLEGALFYGLPLPLENQFDGCKLDMIGKFKSAGRNETGINSISNITSPNDLDMLLSGTAMVLENEKIFVVDAADIHHEAFPDELTRCEFGYPVCTWRGNVNTERGDRMSVFRKFTKQTGKAWADIIPKKYGDLFDEAPLGEQGGDPFKNPPRSKTLYRIGFLLLSEEHCMKTWNDPHTIGNGTTFNNLFKKLEVSKAAISNLLAEWDMLFERERTDAGKVKYGGWIRLSDTGREFLTSRTIAEKGELPFDWMDQLLADLKRKRYHIRHNDMRQANWPEPFWDQWTDLFLANWDAEQTERDFPH